MRRALEETSFSLHAEVFKTVLVLPDCCCSVCPPIAPARPATPFRIRLALTADMDRDASQCILLNILCPTFVTWVTRMGQERTIASTHGL